MAGRIDIADLREVPEHCDAVADRVWNAWWRSKGTSLQTIREWVDDTLRSTPIPFAVVAHSDGRFVGTASVIESDLKERPDLSPWVAAVWVDPEHRRTGAGTALVKAATKQAFAVTKPPIHLCARRPLAPFYESLGWQRIVEDIGGLDIYRHFGSENDVG